MSEFAITDCINLVFLAKIKKFCAFGRRGYGARPLLDFWAPHPSTMFTLGGLDRAVVARLANGHEVVLAPEQIGVALVPLPVVDDQTGGVMIAMATTEPLAGEQVAQQDLLA